MSISILSFSDRVRYTLYGLPFGVLVIKEPGGWRDDMKELQRNKKYFGITANFSNSSLQFYGDAKTALKSAYDQDGVLADVKLIREVRDDNTDEWKIDYTSNLDFKSYNETKNYIKIKFDESLFFKKIENRFREKYELGRLTDINGNPIPPLQYQLLNIQGRDIFRETLFDNSGNDGAQTIRINYKGSDTYDALDDVAVPLLLNYRSDENFFAPTIAIDTSGYVDLQTARIARDLSAPNVIYNSGNVYYLTADENKTIHQEFSITFRAKFTTPGSAVGTLRIYRDLVRDDGGDMKNFDTVLVKDIATSYPVGTANYISEGAWYTYTVSFTIDTALIVGDSLGLRFSPFFSGSYNKDNQFQIEILEQRLLNQEDDLGETTDCQALTMYQVFERLIWIVTGKQCFFSDLLLYGTWKDLLLTSGFFIRKFPDKEIAISIDECWEAMNTIDDIALFVVNETVALETKRRAFSLETAIELGTVSNITRSVDEDTHFSSIEIGYDFNGIYEEVNGVDEFNIKNIYSTCIDTLENVHKAVSKVRTDSSGMTFAQNKPFANFPKEDTRYDKENFMVDCIIQTSGSYKVRHWELDFADQPTGIFSPDTAFNLRLSPFNCLLRKGKYLSTGLQKFPTKKIRYSSTEGNSQLVTLYPERAEIENSVLPVPYFLPELIEFEKKISMAQFWVLVNNPYKLIKFTNEYGEAEWAYIYPSVQPNKDGKFKVIKANT